jgi:cell division protein FtsX
MKMTNPTTNDNIPTLGDADYCDYVWNKYEKFDRLSTVCGTVSLVSIVIAALTTTRNGSILLPTGFIILSVIASVVGFLFTAKTHLYKKLIKQDMNTFHRTFMVSVNNEYQRDSLRSKLLRRQANRTMIDTIDSTTDD